MKLSKKAIIGYPAGIITGVAYGLNPLFAMPLIQNGAPISSILFFRYLIAVLLLGAFLLITRHSFKVSAKQAGVFIILGFLFAFSSIFLFEAYNYISSGLATTLVFISPILVAIIMVFLRVIPSWPVWASIFATFIGVIIMTQGSPEGTVNPVGILLSLASALSYAVFMVIINRSKTIGAISNSLLTFYILLTGTVIFFVKLMFNNYRLTTGIDNIGAWGNLVGLAILPTIVSTATLAVATRNIGATKASVLEVFEPITAILIGTLVFGEALTANIVSGITLSVVAVTFMIASTGR